ncbi:MAG: hypothetical protein RIK87_20230 [Fuerstiella sp.]
MADLAKLRMPDDEVADWFRSSLQVAFSQVGDHQRNQRIVLSKRRSELATMNDRLLNAFLAGSIDEPTFNAKLAALRDEAAQIEERLGNVATLEPPDVRAALAVFEFSQNVPDLWRGSKMLEKRRILETLSLNRMLGDVTLVLEKRKPFDELAKRPSIQLSRDDRIRTCDLYVPNASLMGRIREFSLVKVHSTTILFLCNTLQFARFTSDTLQ